MLILAWQKGQCPRPLTAIEVEDMRESLCAPRACEAGFWECVGARRRPFSGGHPCVGLRKASHASDAGAHVHACLPGGTADPFRTLAAGHPPSEAFPASGQKSGQHAGGTRVFSPRVPFSSPLLLTITQVLKKARKRHKGPFYRPLTLSSFAPCFFCAPMFPPTRR